MKRSQLKKLIKEVVAVLNENPQRPPSRRQGWGRVQFTANIERDGDPMEVQVEADYYKGTNSPDDPIEADIVQVTDQAGNLIELSTAEDADVMDQLYQHIEDSKQSGEDDYWASRAASDDEY